MSPGWLRTRLRAYQALRLIRDRVPPSEEAVRYLNGFVDTVLTEATLATQEDACDWCQQTYPAERLCGLSNTPERLCPGCYHCWRHGAPRLERDERHREVLGAYLRQEQQLRAVLNQPLPRDAR